MILCHSFSKEIIFLLANSHNRHCPNFYRIVSFWEFKSLQWTMGFQSSLIHNYGMLFQLRAMEKNNKRN